MYNIRQDRGLTLIEIIVVLFLFSIILGAIFSVLATGRLSWNSGASQLSVQQDGRRAINSMIKEMRQTGVSTITGVPADGVNYSSITFQIPTAISVSGITWSTNIQYSLGGLNGKQLLRTQSGTQRILANNISALAFKRNGATPNVINIATTVTKDTFPGFTTAQSTITFSSEVRVRN